ncbi:hypothetical protein [Gloeocapsopsis dulcis]|uniref:hypothetical protein n=1 Tax=Gloeocapsopsis dulcis TaxID=2859516 RepID=UPI002B25B5EC|nr:hypothetical protein [Gloeocapsopsis dulcis]
MKCCKVQSLSRYSTQELAVINDFIAQNITILQEETTKLQEIANAENLSSD